jgi:hypothetical protein
MQEAHTILAVPSSLLHTGKEFKVIIKDGKL